MFFNISQRALVFASLLSLFLAVSAAPITPSEDTGAGVMKRQLKQFDIRSPTKASVNRRHPSPVPELAGRDVNRRHPSPVPELAGRDVNRRHPSPVPKLAGRDDNSLGLN